MLKFKILIVSVLFVAVHGIGADAVRSPSRTLTFQPTAVLIKAREKAKQESDRAEAAVVSAQQSLYAANREGKQEFVLLAKQLIEQSKTAAADARAHLKDIEQQLTLAELRKDKCKDLEQQLRLERETLQKLQHALRQNQSELDTWTAAHEDARRKALVSGGEFILEHVGWEMENRCTALASFNSWFIGKESELKERGVSFPNLRAKIDEARTSYTNAMIHSQSSPLLKTGVPVEELWSQLRNYATSIAYEQALADAAMRSVLDNPAFDRYLKTDISGANLAEAVTRQFGKSKELPKITSTELDFETFITQFGYKPEEWAARRRKIPQQAGAPTAAELEAVNALKARIEVSMQKLADCYSKVSE